MYTFLNLRKPGDTGYKIPNGGGFSLISAPNYFGNHLKPHLKIKITILKTKKNMLNGGTKIFFINLKEDYENLIFLIYFTYLLEAMMNFGIRG